MKRGLIGPYQLGVLSGASEALKIAEELSGQPGFDLESVFYASAFQAGVDRFLFPESTSIPVPSSEFVRERIEPFGKDPSIEHSRMVADTLSRVLPENWQRDERFSNVWSLHCFLSDLLDAMALKSSYLAVWGIPDAAELEGQLPRELLVPIDHFLKSFQVLQPALPAVQRGVTREDFRRLCEILQGDVFRTYSESQSHFDNGPVPVEQALSEVTLTSRKLVSENPRLLSLAKGGLGVLSLSAKLIDAVFGKIPGAAAEGLAKLGQQLLDQERRIVVYDFSSTVKNLLMSNLVRMIRAAEKAKATAISPNAS